MTEENALELEEAIFMAGVLNDLDGAPFAPDDPQRRPEALRRIVVDWLIENRPAFHRFAPVPDRRACEALSQAGWRCLSCGHSSGGVVVQGSRILCRDCREGA